MSIVLVHPRKVIWSMRDFLNQASPLMYTEMTFPEHQETLTTEELLKSITFTKLPRRVRLVKDTQFFAKNMFENTGEDVPSDFIIGYDSSFKCNEKNDEFVEDFILRCPIASEFAHITLSLLHELGHHVTYKEERDNYDRDFIISFIGGLAKEEGIPVEQFNREIYFRLPDEMDATNWAISWLQNEENRKIAKAFEERFFACFKDA